MDYEWIEWDDENIIHATRHGVSVAEIEQAINNANRADRHRISDRRIIRSGTDGGRPVLVIVQLRPDNGVRPITAREA